MAVVANDILKAVWWANNTAPQAGIRQAFHFRVDDPGNGVEADIATDLATNLQTVWNSVQAILTTDYVASKVYCTNETQRTFLGDPAVVYAGTDAGDDLPGPVCALVLARTGKLGQQGRKYIGPLGVAAQQEGVIQLAALTALQNFGSLYSAGFVGGVSGCTCTPGVAKYPGNLQPPTFTAFDPNLSAAQGRTRTQRRRRTGVGI